MAGHLIERRQRAAVQDLSREGQPSRRTGRQASCDKHGGLQNSYFFFLLENSNFIIGQNCCQRRVHSPDCRENVCQTLVWTMLDVSGKMRLLRLEAQDSPLRRGCASRHPSHCPGHTSRFVAQNVRKTGTRGSTFKKILGFRLPRG